MYQSALQHGRIMEILVYFRLFPVHSNTGVDGLTFRTDLADFLHIVLGAIVDGMCDSALADRLVLAG